MPHVSRYKHSKDVEEKLVKCLNQVLSKIENTQDMFGFLTILLTETESIMLAKRFSAVILIEEKLKDAEIARKLHLTRMTVSKIRYFYEARGGSFRVALNKLKRHGQFETINNFLMSLPE